MTELPYRDADGSWATPETWTCKRDRCECRSENAISTPLTEPGDIE